MILYKYVSFEAAKEIITGNAIGFAFSYDFNDPFELTAYPELSTELFDRLRSELKRTAWALNSAILCLTRSALNPLMWAHYADSHRGIVLGLDARVAGLCDESCNTIPAHVGNVVYTSRRPTHDLASSGAVTTVGSEYAFRPDAFEKFQRLFLFKPACWAYEEEVRVVKCVNGIERTRQLPSGRLELIQLGERKLCLYSLPHDSIREVYLGARSVDVDSSELAPLLTALDRYHPARKLMRCAVGQVEWSLEAEDLE